MTCYLWCIIEKNTFRVAQWAITTDRNPTHSDATRWVLVKEFVL